MTPEMKAAIMQLLQGGGSGGNDDAGQDYDQICQVVETKLQPAFEMIGKEFKSQRDEINELKDIVYKMVTSFSDAVGGYKRQGLSASISGKYGADLDALRPIYSDFQGGDILEDLLDALQGEDGDTDGLADQAITTLKGRFGKYLGGTPAPGKEVSLEVSTEGPGDPSQAEDDKSATESPDMGGEVKETESDDPVRKIMNQVSSLRRRKTA